MAPRKTHLTLTTAFPNIWLKIGFWFDTYILLPIHFLFYNRGLLFETLPPQQNSSINEKGLNPA
jgi:hypothetical protein